MQKNLKNIVLFYTYSLIPQQLMDKKIKPSDTNEKVILDILLYIKNIASSNLSNLTDDEIEEISKFRKDEKILNSSEDDFVDFIFAVSIFSISLGKSKTFISEKIDNEAVYLCNLFFNTLNLSSKEKEDLNKKIEKSVLLSYMFLEKNGIINE